MKRKNLSGKEKNLLFSQTSWFYSNFEISIWGISLESFYENNFGACFEKRTVKTFNQLKEFIYKAPQQGIDRLQMS